MTAPVIALRILKAAPGFEPGNGGFADLCLTTWLYRRFSEFRDECYYKLTPLSSSWHTRSPVDDAPEHVAQSILTATARRLPIPVMPLPRQLPSPLSVCAHPVWLWNLPPAIHFLWRVLASRSRTVIISTCGTLDVSKFRAYHLFTVG